MEKGPPKKTEREYQIPLSVFDAVHAQTGISAPDSIYAEKRDEIESEDDSVSGRSLDKDFLFPLHTIF